MNVLNLPTLQASRRVTLSFSLTRDFPVGCLLCLVKEVIYLPRSKDQGKSSPPPQKPASFTSLTIPLKCRNVNIPWANYWAGHVRGDQVPTLSASFWTLRLFTVTDKGSRGGRTLAKNWIMLWRLVQGGGSGESKRCGGQISPSIIHLRPINRIGSPVLLWVDAGHSIQFHFHLFVITRLTVFTNIISKLSANHISHS